jgi:hypothetical protein
MRDIMLGKERSISSLLLVALAVAVVAAMIFALSTSSASYDPYNSEWDGTTEVRTMAETTGVQVELARDSATYSSVPPGETVAFVLSPDSPYRSQELTRTTDFVRRGGTLVVADDYGPHANELLRQLGASARLDGWPVRDVRSNHRSAAMPVVTPVGDHPFVDGVESVTLNHGTVVEPGEAIPLLKTSEHAYVDADRNGELGPNETLEVHTVATIERVGEGRVVVVGDSSVFINAMVERPGNEAFFRAFLSGHSTIVLDHSHTEDLSPAVVAVFALRESATLQFGLGMLAIGALVIWSHHPGFVRSRISGALSSAFRRRNAESSPPDVRATSDELAAHLEREHPDWDRERVERVASALKRRRDR